MAVEADQAAEALHQAHVARSTFQRLPAARLGDHAFAYAVQDALVARRQAAGGGEVVGWKIGFTTAKMQDLAGIAEPAAGAMLARGLWSSGATLARDDAVHIGLEGEIAVRVAEAFPETDPVDSAGALARLDLVAAAFEVTDDRHADWAEIEAASLIADDIWNVGLVLGPPTPVGALGRLTGRRGVVTVNGAVRDEGRSDDIGCDPAAIVAWLGAHLARRGRPLAVVQWIMTGSFVPTTFPEAGDRYAFAVEGLGTVEVSIA